MRNAVDPLRGEMERQRISLELDLGGDPLPVHIDPIQIEQVILNLVRNAVEALAQSTGERTLQIRTAHAGANAVEFAVTDSGPGSSAKVTAPPCASAWRD